MLNGIMEEESGLGKQGISGLKLATEVIIHFEIVLFYAFRVIDGCKQNIPINGILSNINLQYSSIKQHY